MKKTVSILQKIKGDNALVLSEWLKENNPNELQKRIALLEYTVDEELYDCFKLLLADKRTDVNIFSKYIEHYTPLMRGIGDGKGWFVQLLLKDKRMDVNVINQNGRSALSIASEQKRRQTVRKLLNAGAIISQTDIDKMPRELESILTPAFKKQKEAEVKKKVGKFKDLLR